MRAKGFVETLYGRKRRFPDYQRVAEEVRRNERKLTQYYIERKPLLNKTSLTSKEQARLDKLQELIAPLASKRGLVNYCPLTLSAPPTQRLPKPKPPPSRAMVRLTTLWAVENLSAMITKDA